MSVVLNEIGPCKKRAEFELNPEEVQSGFNQVYEEICETISFPGFRKGKVPRALVARKHGKDILPDVREKLLRKSFFDMVEEHKLELISQPSFDEKGRELKEGDAFAFSVSFEVRPAIDLPEYKGIKLEKKVRKVSEAHLKDTRRNLLESHARLEEVSDAFAEGDLAKVSLEAHGRDGDVLYHNHNAVAIPAQNRLDIFEVVDLSKALLEKKAGESFEVVVEVPDPFTAKEELAGQKLKISAEVQSVHRRTVPELNEEFLRQLGFDDQAAFDETLTKMLENEFEARSRAEMKKQIYDYFADKVDSEMPEDAVRQHSEYLVNMKLFELTRAGVPVEEAKGRREEFAAEALEEARREIKVGFVLNKVAETEKVFVTERDIGKRIVALAQQRKMNPEKLREELEEKHEIQGIRDQLKEEKVIDLVIRKAEIKEIEVGDEEDRQGTSEKTKANKADA